MSTAIAFLSGKGGSGKTTLALGMADLLSCCGIPTLLIDCDLSTNGATYFYEAYLSNQNQIDSFSRYIHTYGSGDDTIEHKEDIYFSKSLKRQRELSHISHSLSTINIKPNYYFIPSISSISNQQKDNNGLPEKDVLDNKLKKLVSWSKENFDVIIFDCQAGYTELLPSLLPMMDADLFVLEADSISASSMRNLHLKIGNFLGKAKLYQVFNKASKEEYDIYSKITGTFFTNIGTLLFDWKIRQAFSRSQTPDLENNSAKYGSDLCDICKVIFPNSAIKSKLESYSKKLLIKQAMEERDKTEAELKSITKSPHRTQTKLMTLLLMLVYIIVICIFMLFAIKDKNILLQSSELQIGLVIAGSAILFTLLLFYVSYFASAREDRRIRLSYEQKIWELNNQIRKLQQEYTNKEEINPLINNVKTKES